MLIYPKIQGLYKRDLDAPTKVKPIIEGAYTCEEFELLRNIMWEWTEKVDGTNIRVIWQPKSITYGQCLKDPTEAISKNMVVTDVQFEVEFRGKTDRAQLPPNLLTRLQQVFTASKLESVFDQKKMFTYILFGEGYGNKVQQKAGKYYAEALKENKGADVDFILFDVAVIYNDGHVIWLERESLLDIAGKLDIDVVPIVGYGTIQQAVQRVKDGYNSIVGNEKLKAEGLVVKPKVTLLNKKGDRIVTKIKVADFKKEE